ncbi:MAG TPA: M35 family metallo-endopeptidase [Myxococcales bacterium]|nr:M35 family metallo-endopeptidase [Myxococcales bacterium]
MLAVAFSSCVGPADDSLPSGGVDEYVSELRPDNAGISAGVGLTRSTFGAADPVTVTLTVRNTSPGAIQLLRWKGPEAQLEESLFTITRDGAPVQYIGPIYKRGTPDAEDYLSIAPGQAVSQEIALSGFYDFTQTGSYQVRYEVKDLAVTTSAGKKTGLLKSNDVTFWVEGRANVSPEPDSIIGGYTRCDSTQQGLLVQAANQATTYATESLNYLSGSPSATPRYVTWFGAYSSSGWNKAKNDYTAIKDAFVTKTLTFDCHCKQKNTYAYVYPTQPYTIYLCGVFWQVPVSGTDSKGGTLIHEMSHFNVTASTDDWAYGQSACKSLALSNPTQALDNADSHEYFAENNPALQ